MIRVATDGFRHEAIAKIALPGSAILALLLGITIYVLDRDWATTLFLAPVARYQPESAGLFGSLGHTLPSFFHAYAFSLLLILALGRAKYARQIGAAAWFVLAAGLEAVQADYFHPLFVSSDAQPGASTVVSSIQSYVVNGQFDPADVAASLLGCVAAFVIASVLEVPK